MVATRRVRFSGLLIKSFSFGFSRIAVSTKVFLIISNLTLSIKRCGCIRRVETLYYGANRVIYW